ncbi:MAG: valine--tRNA ligase, partial [Clostridia bacterium]|nr:valine--tRNA ligase [Clostridia bacterium]
NGPLMLAEYPRYNSKFNYSTSVKEVEPVKDIIKAIRNIKVKVGAAPSKKVALYVKTDNKKVIKNGEIYISKLAGVSEITLIDDPSLITEKTVSQVMDGIVLYIPLGDLVDFEKELARLNQELLRVENELKRANGKLSNNGFLDKAPKSLVDAERAKLNKYLDMREKLQNQIKEING